MKSMPLYTLRKSKRAKYFRLAVYPDGRVVLTAPARAAVSVIEQFFHERSEWLRGKLDWLRTHPSRAKRVSSPEEYTAHRESALALVETRVAHFNHAYGFVIKSLRIRNQKTRWGSCSSRGNISINYRIVFLPPALQDYLVVHELCHLRELNHSSRFWALVGQTLPDYRERKRELRRYDLSLL